MLSRQFLEVVLQTKRNKSEEKTKTSRPPLMQAPGHQNTRRSRYEERTGNEKLLGYVCVEIKTCHNLKLNYFKLLLFSFLKIFTEHKKMEMQLTSGESNEGLEMANHAEEILPAVVEVATQTRKTGENVSVQFRSTQTSRTQIHLTHSTDA